MAIFKPTIFQDISGSVGNVITYKIGKTQIARGKPGFVKDAKTLEQLKQRARLSLITKLRRRFLKVLSVGYCSSSGKVCANCFTRDNIHKVNVEDVENPTIDLLTLSLSSGELRLPLIKAEVDKEKRLVIFQWEQQPLMPFMAKEDRLIGVIHEREEMKSRLVELGTRGKSGEKAWYLPKDWNVNQLVVYGFAVSENGQNASDTLGLITTNRD